MISTLSSAAAGMEFVSMISVELTGCARRPSIRTRVRFAPRPRRLMDETPGVLVALGKTSEVLNCVCVVGTYCGSWFSTDSTAMVLDSWNALFSTVTTGLAASRSRRTMREPVTVTSVSSCPPAGAASCA